jgi:hypothetical protein
MLYGICTECGTPRAAEMICTTDEDGSLNVEHRFDPTTCPHMATRYAVSSP